MKVEARTKKKELIHAIFAGRATLYFTENKNVDAPLLHVSNELVVFSSSGKTLNIEKMQIAVLASF